MAGKISQYPSAITTLESGDLFDVSEFLNPGYESKKLDWSTLLTELNSQITFQNFATDDLTLTGNRVHDLGVNDLTFGSTGDANLMKFETTNNRIGIGIGTPSEKLHVVGNGLIDDGVLTVQTTGAGNPAIITINGDKDNTNPDDDSVTSVFRMITDSDVSPYGFNIDVLNGNAQSKTKFYHYKGGAAKEQIMFWDNSARVGIGSMTAMTSKLQVQADNAGTASVFLVEASTGADILRVTEDQKVGIGTGAAPAQKLHVQGNQYISGNLGIGTTTPSQKLEVVGKTLINGGSDSLLVSTTGATNNLVVKDISGSSFVGVRTATRASIFTPESLGVNGEFYTSVRANILNTALVTTSGGTAVFASAQAGQDVRLATTSATDNIELKVGAVNVLFGQATTGNVGIGTTTPSEKLEVAGNTYTTGQGSFGTIINPNSQLQVTASGKIVGIVGVSNAITAGGGAAIRGTAKSTAAVEIYGVDGGAEGTNATGDRTGVRGSAITTGSRNHVGVKGTGTNGTQQNIGVWGTTGNGTTGTVIRGVNGSSLYTGASNAYAGYFSAQGASTGENIGIFATAVNGATNYAIKSDGNVNMANLPTSSAGLSAGDLWNNAGVINIV